MKRIIIVISAIIFALICIVQPANAYESEDHNKLMSEILFGKDNYKDTIKSMQPNNYKNIVMLENASYLCIDQFNDNGQDKLDNLRENHVHNIPKNISTINFAGGSAHRKYTHMGWNFDYKSVLGKDEANFEARKNILLQTVNKVFKFNFFAGTWFGINFGYSEQCVAMSELIYYIHILGDCLARNSFEYSTNSIELAKEHPSDDNSDLFYELDSIFKVLFSSQSNTRVYQGFIHDLTELAEETRILVGSTGGINSDEKFKEYQNYCENLKTLLVENIPKLLKNESFFSEIFNQEESQ